MPLTQEQEDREYELRVNQMIINIEKLRSDIRYENRKFVVQAVAGFGTAMAAGAAVLGLVLHLMGKI